MGKKIPDEKKVLLEAAQNYCDDNDKSTEFMIQYMQDYADVSHDVVMQYLKSQSLR